MDIGYQYIHETTRELKTFYFPFGKAPSKTKEGYRRYYSSSSILIPEHFHALKNTYNKTFTKSAHHFT